MRETLRRLWYFLRQRRLDAELAEEIEFHRALTEQDLAARGLDAGDARATVRRRLGNVALAREHARDLWRPRVLHGLVHDIRLAARTLRATPLVTSVAVVSLALGIGANTAVFSLVSSLMLRTLPVREPERLVLIARTNTDLYPTWGSPVVQQLRRRPQLFDGIAAWSATPFNLATTGEAELVDGLWANGEFFATLGVPAYLGRTISIDDDRAAGGHDGPVAVFSYRFWQRRFAGAADAIGRTLVVDSVPVTVVGVTPPGFNGPDVGRTFDIVLPLGAEPVVRKEESRSIGERGPGLQMFVLARLHPHQTIDEATSALAGVRAQIMDATVAREWPERERAEYLKDGFALRPAATGNRSLSQRYDLAVLAMLAAVVIVLLIACVNIANLAFARTTARLHELAVRRALGASRWRIVRQLLMEGAILASVGGGSGLWLAWWGSRAIVKHLSSGSDPVFLDLSLDWRVLMFTLAVSAATAALIGLWPALRGSTNTRADQRRGVSGTLVVIQVALSLVLVVGAGLFVGTFWTLVTRPLGLDRDRVLMVTIEARRATSTLPERVALFEQVRGAVASQAGISAAAISLATPVSTGPIIGQRIEAVSGTPALPDDRRLTVIGMNIVSPDWFRTFGVAILEGRDFTARDRAGAPPVAVVNQAFARRFVNGASPIGRTITLAPMGPQPNGPIEIVGLTTDSVYGAVWRSMEPTIYVPLPQATFLPLQFMATATLGVRAAAGSPTALSKRVADAVTSVSRNVTLVFRPLSDQVAASLAQERVLALLSGALSVVAMLMAGLGLFGVTSFTVSRRQKEIGIRMALGARVASVVGLVLSRLMVMVALGVVLGGVGSWWASRFIENLLYGLAPRLPLTLLASALILMCVAALAAWLPARRASRIDPVVVLRYE